MTEQSAVPSQSQNYNASRLGSHVVNEINSHERDERHERAASYARRHLLGPMPVKDFLKDARLCPPSPSAHIPEGSFATFQEIMHIEGSETLTEQVIQDRLVSSTVRIVCQHIHPVLSLMLSPTAAVHPHSLSVEHTQLVPEQVTGALLSMGSQSRGRRKPLLDLCLRLKVGQR